VNPLQAAAMAVVGLGWLALLWGLVSRARRGGGRSRSRDPRSLGGMALQGVGMAVAFSGHERGASATPATILRAAGAIGLAVAGAGFIVAAIRTLGKQWSLTARVLEDHRLVTTGPYARVRHPIYSGLLALLLATGLANATPSETGVAALVYVAGTLLRIRREEGLLRAAFGPEYEAYAKRVPALVPRLRAAD
jgi:protein-S-isoprenylcysteine O-methyltransferase Ste14